MNAFDVAVRVGQALSSCKVAYFLGGSMASSLQGEPRATNDLDFVVDLQLADVDRLASALGPDFEVDAESLKEAVAQRRSWNIFFLPLLTKIDLFVKGTSSFDESEFARRREVVVGADRVFIKSPEDTVLRKLLWYRQGGQVSEHQLRDVVNVLRVNSSTLDRSYLDAWAKQLGIEDLLTRAERDAAPRR